MVLYYLLPRKNRNVWTISAILLAVVLNGVFSYINDKMGFPIFLDSVFTVMAAVLFGLWPSVAVGIMTNSFIEVLNGFPGYYLPFTPVNLLTALTVSLFVMKKRFETASNAFWLIIALTFINSLAGTIIVTLFFGGYTYLSLDNIVRGITLTGRSIFSSAFTVRLAVNLVDKGIAVLPAYFVYKRIEARFTGQK